MDLAAGVLDDDVTRGLERKRVSGRKNFTRQNYVDSPGRAISLAMGNKGPMPTQELTIGSDLSPSLTLLISLCIHPCVTPLGHTEEPTHAADDIKIDDEAPSKAAPPSTSVVNNTKSKTGTATDSSYHVCEIEEDGTCVRLSLF